MKEKMWTCEKCNTVHRSNASGNPPEICRAKSMRGYGDCDSKAFRNTEKDLEKFLSTPKNFGSMLGGGGSSS